MHNYLMALPQPPTQQQWGSIGWVALILFVLLAVAWTRDR